MPGPRYPDELRRAAVAAVVESDVAVSEIARRFGIHQQTLRSWLAMAGMRDVRTRAMSPTGQSELSLPRRHETSSSAAGQQTLTNGDPQPSEILLDGLSVPKASDVLSRSLREQILSGRIVPDTVLPTERDLSAASGLSRGTVREALRILELEGLVAIKPGRSGGAVVRRPAPDVVDHHLRIFIQGRQLSLDALLEVREALEPVTAELAARRRTQDQLDALSEATCAVEDVIDDLPAYLRTNLEWHITVADISGNDLLAAIMRSLSKAIFEGTAIEDFNSADIRSAAAAAHRRVLRAIRDQDPRGAFNAMRHHVHTFRDEINERGSGSADITLA
ncbi:FCD domain-containing protein [Nocardia rhamnosiphila]|uniref:FCD domain-containing protein n=1 Tax=Nocardia rhamnosiphila TaxID=426716 RepID=A0ABV2X255_9NOCA